MKTWPYAVQWADRFSITYSFRTAVSVSADGTEQRIAQRYKARRVFEFTSMLHGAALGSYARTLSDMQRRPVLVAEAPRRVRVLDTALAGSSVLTLVDIPEWVQEGRSVAVLYGDHTLILEVTSSQGSTLLLSSPLTEAVPAGIAVAPAVLGFVAESVSFSLHTLRAVQGRVSVAIDPTADTAFGSADEIYGFDGRELFDFSPNLEDPPEQTYSQTRQVVDYGKGAVDYFFPVLRSAVTYQINLDLFDDQSVNRFVGFFLRQKGKQKAFLFEPPSAQPLFAAGSYVPGSMTVRLRGKEALLRFQQDQDARILSVRGGYSTYYRKVVSAIAIGQDTQVTFNMAIPEVISDTDPFSWVLLTRFDSDDLVVDWITDAVASCSVAIRSLAYADNDDVSGFDPGVRWLYEYYGQTFVNQIMFDGLDQVLNVKEPRFALVLDLGTEYLLTRYTRHVAETFILDGTLAVLNVKEPRFAEIRA